MRWIMLGVWLVCAAPLLGAGVDLTVELPAGTSVKEAVANNPETKSDTAGSVQEGKVVFHGLLPDTPYDLRLTLADGTVLQGVDLGWYNPEPAKADAQALSDDDREQIRAILQDVKSFTNRNDILQLKGDHNRAVLLAQLIRDKDFHADKGGEIIWRIEVWYLKNNYGGWEKIAQVSKVLRRERFADAAAFKAATQKIKWLPELGGVRVAKGEETIKLEAAK